MIKRATCGVWRWIGVVGHTHTHTHVATTAAGTTTTKWSQTLRQIGQFSYACQAAKAGAEKQEQQLPSSRQQHTAQGGVVCATWGLGQVQGERERERRRGKVARKISSLALTSMNNFQLVERRAAEMGVFGVGHTTADATCQEHCWNNETCEMTALQEMLLQGRTIRPYRGTTQLFYVIKCVHLC